METMMLMAGLDLPVRAIRQQLRGALNVLVHVGRLADGRRKILSIAELTGIDDQTIALQELFVSEATGGAVPGRTRLMPTGIRPQMMDKVYQRGVEVPELSRLFPKSAPARWLCGAARPPPPPRARAAFLPATAAKASFGAA
jgi:hypothetical protein